MKAALLHPGPAKLPFVALCRVTGEDITTCVDYPEEHGVLITLAKPAAFLERGALAETISFPQTAVKAYRELAEGDIIIMNSSFVL